MKSIEFAHFIHPSPSEVAQNLQLLQAFPGPYTTVILIDDYHHPDAAAALLPHLIALKPDAIVSEAQLTPLAEELLTRLQNLGTIESRADHLYLMNPTPIRLTSPGPGHRKYSCALLAAAWYLCRLGFFSLPARALLHGQWTTAPALINVLDRRYRTSELKTLNILQTLQPHWPIENYFY